MALVRGYSLLGPLVSAGQCQWAFAERDGKEFFLKQFLQPTYPTEESDGTEEGKRPRLDACTRFEAHQQRLRTALRPLSKPGGNLVVTVDFFREGARYYKITERVETSTLSPVDVAALDLATRLQIMLSVVANLVVLHRARIVHGDIKPENVLIQEVASGYRSRLIDFDNAYFDGEPEEAPDEIVGTPNYYSPELLTYIRGGNNGASLGLPSDIFALGVLFAQYLTGSWPVPATAASGDVVNGLPVDMVLAGSHLTLAPVGLPAPVTALVERMLLGDPGKRPGGDQLHSELKEMRHWDAQPGGIEAGSRRRSTEWRTETAERILGALSAGVRSGFPGLLEGADIDDIPLARLEKAMLRDVVEQELAAADLAAAVKDGGRVALRRSWRRALEAAVDVPPGLKTVVRDRLRSVDTVDVPVTDEPPRLVELAELLASRTDRRARLEGLLRDSIDANDSGAIASYALMSLEAGVDSPILVSQRSLEAMMAAPKGGSASESD